MTISKKQRLSVNCMVEYEQLSNLKIVLADAFQSMQTDGVLHCDRLRAVAQARDYYTDHTDPSRPVSP